MQGRFRNRLCAAAALAALILYPVAISLPILTVERMGHRHHSSVWKGVAQFLGDGQWFVGLTVLICSILIPLLKLLGMLLLVFAPRLFAPHNRARLHRVIEWSGKWGMLDVLLISILVAWVKMGDLVTIRPGKAVVAFCLMVLLSLIASASFDASRIWQTPKDRP
ncbi:MAG: paraquat-inducible protein A [Planctomycetota bacterium]